MPEMNFVLALTAGFLGGFGHCIGMCGPIVASYALHLDMPGMRAHRLISHLLYNAGRIMTYVFIGSLMGAAGQFLSVGSKMSELQNIVSIGAGILMLLMGMDIIGLFSVIKTIEKKNSLVLKMAKAALEGFSVWRYFTLGLVMGFIPCGLSYSIFIAAAASGSLFSGMTTAFFFGLGTLPSLFAFGSLISFIGAGVRGLLYRLSGAVVIGMGLYWLIRGVSAYVKV
ncbi:MAG: sulfite exporter TauE/SafE family protein [Nitrospirae bacterium]|nr:MAG: sulfite exporter TauE/SafE family protein [Nitrospirota bacterium]